MSINNYCNEPGCLVINQRERERDTGRELVAVNVSDHSSTIHSTDNAQGNHMIQ